MCCHLRQLQQYCRLLEIGIDTSSFSSIRKATTRNPPNKPNTSKHQRVLGSWRPNLGKPSSDAALLVARMLDNRYVWQDIGDDLVAVMKYVEATIPTIRYAFLCRLAPQRHFWETFFHSRHTVSFSAATRPRHGCDTLVFNPPHH